MSMPSIEDETWQYWCNEVEANCPTLSDKYHMAYKVLDYHCFKQPSESQRYHFIQTLIDNYLEHADVSDMVHLIADAIRNKEVEYD